MMDPLRDAINELQNCQDDVPIFRKLISASFNPEDDNQKEFTTIVRYIIQIISNNSEFGNERALLACHAFYVLFSKRCDSHHKDIIIYFQELKSCDMYFYAKQYTISDLELFKLLNVHGYLQVIERDEPMYFDYDILLSMFDVLFKNCIKYTRYTYFAYKVLYMWVKRLEKTNDSDYYVSDCLLERKLETILFSNWCNALNDVRRQNAKIYNVYLQIMARKYMETFLIHIFYSCFLDISWQNETRYIILAEVLQVWDKKLDLVLQPFLSQLCISLKKNSLRSGSTKLYLVILRKLNEDKWKNMFRKIIKSAIKHWDSGKNEDHNALQSLFKYWLEPTIEMHRNVLPFLWTLCDNSQGYFFRSHLLRVAAKLHIKLHKAHIDHYIKNKNEIIRLNAFAVLCYCVVNLIDNEADSFSLIKQFLWFNANTAAILMREGIIKYFKILCSNVFKMISIKADCIQSISEFMEWLDEFFLDCFEIGSCYQRKILALNLYKIVLSFTDGYSHKTCAHHKQCLRYVTAIEHLKTTDSWKFTNKENLFLLLRLVLDSSLDVRQLATVLILEYFEKDVLSIMEKRILYKCAWEHCNSSKFYKIESGAALIKIMAHWSPLNEIYKNKAAIFVSDEYDNILDYSSYSEFLLNEAQCQLEQMKSDILKAIVQNRPFYGVLTALLTVAFRAGPEKWILTPHFTEKVLNLSKDAVDFFLSTLSTKASNTVYSSSFAEMGLAIDEQIKISEIENPNYDELQLSPAHQVLISCIWMSLKVSCEIVSEIGMLMQSDAQVKRSMKIIVTVLLKCRHKGVVESAGVAIANLSRRLYNKNEYSELPKAYLMSLLEDTEKSLHLTRRGAGLSIMFHRLVVSDNRKDRPTVHFAVQTLLRSLENFSTEAVRNVETGQDSPWAKRLHFLRALVADKEIHAQLISYMEEICLRCFDYMKSDVWTVRNASLQLYGAVVPRLVGQCSERDGKTLDFGDGYSVNHFVTHYQILASRIWTQLRDVSKLHGTSNAALRSYSSIAHILILLSKLSIGGCEFIDYPSEIFVTKIKSLLFIFLSNPMVYIRQLAAKAYAALTPSVCISLEMKMLEEKILTIQDVNRSHGYLLTHGYLREKYNNDINNSINSKLKDVKFDWMNLERHRYLEITHVWHSMHKLRIQPCYILETLFLQESPSKLTADNRSYFCNNLSVIERMVSSQKIQPGFFQFVGHWARLYAAHLKRTCDTSSLDDSTIETIRNIMNSSCIEQGIEFLKGLSPCVPLLEFFLEYLISVSNNSHQLLFDEIVTFTLKTIRHIILETNEKLEFDNIIEKLNEIEMTVANSKVTRVRNALILAFSKCETLINKVLSHVFDVCTDEEESTRLTAAEYIEFALHRFTQLSDSNRLTIVRCCLILLKDEIAEIREIVSTSLQRSVFSERIINTASHQLQHEEIVYQRLLLIHDWFTSIADDNVDFIRYFTRAIKDVDSNATIENPFDHDDNTFHREESKFLNMCFLYDFPCDNRGIREDYSDVIRAIQTRHFRKIQEKAGFRYDDLRIVLHLKEMDYLRRKRDVVTQQQN